MTVSRSRSRRSASMSTSQTGWPGYFSHFRTRDSSACQSPIAISAVSDTAAATRSSSGSATDDHQTANAQALAHAGGAVVIAQDKFTVERVAAAFADLLGDPEQLSRIDRKSTRLNSSH